MTEPREVELKLEMGPEDAARLRRRVLPRIGGGGTTTHLVSVYFDTRKRTLRKKNLTLRVRQVGDRFVQTVKQGEAVSAGFFDRAEWESEIQGESPDLAAAATTPVGDIIAKQGPTSLAPVFTTVIDRTTWQITQGTSQIEIALDEGHVESLGATRPIAELELELKQGLSRDLFALIRRIDRVGALKLAVLSKSERGYALAEPDEPQFYKAAPVALRPDMSVAEAFRTIAHACIRHLRLNETPLMATRSPEALHQMRVAMRRLRSAFSLFGPVLVGAQASSLKRRLRDMAGQFGDARNLDVYLARAIRPETERDPAEPGLSEYVQRIESDRERAYDGVLATLASKPFRKLMLDLVAWLERGSAPGGNRRKGQDPVDGQGAGDLVIGDFAASVLERHRRKLKRKGRRLDEMSPDERHQVRIEAKKLRYASEFFAGLVQGHKARGRHKDYVAALAAVQANLGDLNDIATGHAIAVAMAASAGTPDGPAPAAAFAAGHVAGEHDQRIDALLHQASAAHRDLVRAKRFWPRPEA